MEGSDIMANESSTRPLVSFCVKCYNQLQYIGEALDGAFAQTYRPLEIIVSDDCSTDGSAEFIQRKISEYVANGGDIPVFFNRNKENLGNVGSWFVFGDIAHGALLVKADGDDVSLPERTEKIVCAWVADGGVAMVVDHAAEVMDLSGRPTGKTRRILGAAQAYSHECWDRFPIRGTQPPREWGGDDTIFSIRAYAIAGADKYQLLVDEPLVRYRSGSGATTAHRKYRNILNTYTTECILYALRDIELNSDSLCSSYVVAARDWCLRRARESELNRQLACGKSFGERLDAALSLRREFGNVSFRDFMYQLMLTLPPMLTDPVLDSYLRIFCKR